MKSIEEIRAAFLKMHHVAMGKEASYMSIPADPQRDADLIVSAAIDELKELREYRDREAERITAGQEALRLAMIEKARELIQGGREARMLMALDAVRVPK